MKWWMEPWPWTLICISLVYAAIIIHSIWRKSKVKVIDIPKYYSFNKSIDYVIEDKIEDEYFEYVPDPEPEPETVVIETPSEPEPLPMPTFEPIKVEKKKKRKKVYKSKSFQKDLENMIDGSSTPGYLLQYNKWDEPVNSAVFNKRVVYNDLLNEVGSGEYRTYIVWQGEVLETFAENILFVDQR